MFEPLARALAGQVVVVRTPRSASGRPPTWPSASRWPWSRA